MQTHTLKRKTPLKKSKPVARGGKRGKTAGRGTKGQKSRSGRKIRPELRDIIKKLPKLRGRGKNSLKSIQERPFAVNIGTLNEFFNNGDTINPEILSEKGLIPKLKSRKVIVKILGGGELNKKLTIQNCIVSKEIREKIEKIGGTIVE
jgi:large subunit ribosomal protein L15